MSEHDFAVIGKGVKRKDGPKKVKGEHEFADDIQFPLMLHGRIKRSDIAHGRIVRIDTSKAEAKAKAKYPGTAADVDIQF